jgi:hypothetical protein
MAISKSKDWWETIVKIPFYEFKLHILYGDFKLIGNEFNIDNLTEDAGRIFKKGSDFFVLFNKNEKLTPGHIAHEAKHLVNKVYLFTGTELDTSNDESECYFLKWMVNTLDKVVNKCIKNNL